MNQYNLESAKRAEIQNAMMKDTPVKSKDNAQYIDSIIAYDREVHRISQSLRCNLDLGQISLPEAQLQNTGRPEIQNIGRPEILNTSRLPKYTKSPQIDITKSIIGLEKYDNQKGQKA